MVMTDEILLKAQEIMKKRKLEYKLEQLRKKKERLEFLFKNWNIM